MHKNICKTALVGPTASGKTSLSIELALKYNLEIISCDSIQVFKHLNIGAAKPDTEERKGIKHHMIDIVEPWKNYDLAMYYNDVNNILNKQENKKLIIVGGTGFYLQALINGLFDAPPSNKKIRENLENTANTDGLNKLYEDLKIFDSVSAKNIHPNDQYRIIRALEVYQITGKTMSSFKKEHSLKPKNINDIKIFVLSPNRVELHRQIELRAEKMFVDGIIQETENLLSMGCSKKSKPMQSIGYKQCIEYIENNISKDETIRLVKKETKALAKRQITWFKRMPNTVLIDDNSTSLISEHLKSI